MKNINYKSRCLFLLASLLTLFSSCSGFTEIDLPSSQLTSSLVFQDKSTANAAMVDIYSKIRDKGVLTGYSSGFSMQLGLYADELFFLGSASASQSNFYNNTLLQSDAALSELWNSSYSQIYAANAVTEGLATSSGISVADKQQLLGEALFVRALIHFYLLNVFGDIPYITATDHKKNSIAVRMPKKIVYEQIKKDLELSCNLLPKAYNGVERVRPNKFAAKALLARLCLYMEN